MPFKKGQSHFVGHFCDQMLGMLIAEALLTGSLNPGQVVRVVVKEDALELRLDL